MWCGRRPAKRRHIRYKRLPGAPFLAASTHRHRRRRRLLPLPFCSPACTHVPLLALLWPILKRIYSGSRGRGYLLPRAALPKVCSHTSFLTRPPCASHLSCPSSLARTRARAEVEKSHNQDPEDAQDGMGREGCEGRQAALQSLGPPPPAARAQAHARPPEASPEAYRARMSDTDERDVDL
jgi:hypothetical protein